MVHGEMQLNRDGKHGMFSGKIGYYLAPGLEVDSNFRFNQHWSVSAGYLLASATVISFPSNPFIEGLLIRRHRAIALQSKSPAQVPDTIGWGYRDSRGFPV